MGIYNAQNQNYQQLMGGLLGLGAGALKASDRADQGEHRADGQVLAMDPDHDETRSRMATIFADTDKDELPIYQYSYKGDPSSTRHIGPMAQDVEKIDPQAVKIDRRRQAHRYAACDGQHIEGSIMPTKAPTPQQIAAYQAEMRRRIAAQLMQQQQAQAQARAQAQAQQVAQQQAAAEAQLQAQQEAEQRKAET